MDVQPCRGLVINAPEFFADPDFKLWLRNGRRKFTWYVGQEIDEWSDVIVLVDPSLTAEGSDADMPEHIWDQIIDLCREHLGASRHDATHHAIRLTNLAD
ncbi:MAG: hypothetical protein H6921_14770 [Sphingomonas sp.]|nr:hypothetical protein [Sphingomonas sp.]